MQTVYSFVLVDSWMIGSRVKHFKLQSEGAFPIHWLPGQFITIHFNHNEKIIKRSYSLANAPGSNCIEFAAGYVAQGPGTEFLFHLKSGDRLEVTGPFGRLVLKDQIPERYILIATSTGITPYRSMIPELRKRLRAYNLSLIILEGVQRREELLYAEDFRQLVLDFPQQVQFIPCYSRLNPEDIFIGEHSGYVQTALPDLKLDPNKDSIYLCGNPAMIDSAFAYLQEQGFTVHQIIREKYISR